MQKFKSVEDLVNQLKPEKPVYCIRKNSIESAVKFFFKKILRISFICFKDKSSSRNNKNNNR